MFFGPKFIAITFTDTAIKAVSAISTASGFKINTIARKSLPPSTVFNGKVTNESVFREALKTFFFENYDSLKTREAVVGLNEQEIFLSGVRFDQKPKDIGNAIKERISPTIPFDPTTAAITYKKVSNSMYQVAITPAYILRFLSSVFKDAGFSVKAMVPIPLVFPKIVGEQKTPYLFISSEEDLIFALVIEGAVTFTSTLKPGKALVDAEKEILLRAKEIIEEEYGTNLPQPLKKIFIFGKEAEFIKSFFSGQNFQAEILLSTKEAGKITTQDIGDISRSLALSAYDSSILVFPKIDVSKNISAEKPDGKKPRFPILYFLIFIAFVLAAATALLYWSNITDVLKPRPDQSTTDFGKEPTSPASPSPAPKTATPSAENKEATPAAEPKEVINKKDLKIQILNGSGVAGAAGDARDFLEGKGYNVAAVGNADNFNYVKTQVRVKESKKQISDLLTKDLQERYDINVGSPLSESAQFDIIIIIGG